MKIKDYLKMPYRLTKQIARHKREMEHWRTMAYSLNQDPSKPHYNPNRATSASFEKCLEMADSLEHTIKDEEERLAEIKEDVMSNIIKLEDTDHRMLLQMRYLTFDSWQDISSTLCYSESYTYKIHGRALECLQDILKKG
ncbi:MAG: hypothetical protein K6F54_05400 [Lachnospiraceae bacterium]|nr:hypothetical protein [Lachnospiraceae bacterium]